MPQRRGGRGRLTAEDWAEAALGALREGGGLAAIAIEPLAARMGTTKGSFYWHFANREALIDAALTRWERQRADEVAAAPSRRREPVARLTELLRSATETMLNDPAELSLYGDAAHPRVAAALRRVTARRLEYLTELFRELGLTEAEARYRGLQVYAGCLGRAQLARAVPGLLPRGEDDRRYLDSVLASLVAH
ncbi:TetR/AcrR family transcriptional regulator [Streptomyces litchfieldiae]|uniref:TetR/AcrR family transcriptional regulator n=1 Tax=Streptomyces litchfieldiae TaxID=3075543 RepID=A0ABU2MVQ5_9ACTN|nr:TetR/AcrR family transcriptional regulator [Streptomyces sp. DSM 44938]MDT0344634.1 TetR/AcrR family transcriptional regulator [Streptomyces sp. DSM 44938]